MTHQQKNATADGFRLHPFRKAVTLVETLRRELAQPRPVQIVCTVLKNVF